MVALRTVSDRLLRKRQRPHASCALGLSTTTTLSPSSEEWSPRAPGVDSDLLAGHLTRKHRNLASTHSTYQASVCNETRSREHGYQLRCLEPDGHDGAHGWTPELIAYTDEVTTP
jgi:hypothetical protein